MKFKSEYSYYVDSIDWNNKLLENLSSTIYQTFHWQEIYKQAYDSKPIFITVRKLDGEIVGQLAGVIHKNFFWEDVNIFSSILGKNLNLHITLNWFYGPIIHDYNYQKEIISELLSCVDKASIENNVSMIRGNSPPLEKMLSNESFLDFNYKIDPWNTYITNLNQSSDVYYESLNKNIRYDIRKSNKQELKFEIAKTKKDYDDFHDLKIESKINAGHNIKSHTKLNYHFFDLHRELLLKNNFEKLFLVKYNDKIIGGLLGVIFNGNIVQHGVGISINTDLLSGPFLTWNSLKYAIDQNFSTFDLGGVNPFPETSKEKNIKFFKSKWGGIKYDNFIYTKILDKKKIMFSRFLKNPNNLGKKIKHNFNL